MSSLACLIRSAVAALALGGALTCAARSQTVPANAVVFSAGQSDPCCGGTLPVSLAAAEGVPVFFASIIGLTHYGCCPTPDVPPDGTFAFGGTDIDPLGAISGIRLPSRLPLLGVFVGPEEPTGSPPATLDFNTIGLDFDAIEPELNQVFFIGDGRNSAGRLQRFVPPAGASRMFLGFADGSSFMGQPTSYGDNQGALTVLPALGSGLLTYFTFDGDLADSCPAGFSTTINGNPTYVPGMNAAAMRFDGDDWIRVNHGGVLTFDLDDQSFSISCFVRFDDLNSEFTVYQDRFGSNASASYNLSMNASYPRLAEDSWFAPGNYACTASAPSARQWVHVATTFDPLVGKRMYVNGQPVDAVAPPAPGFQPNNHGVLTIGAGWYPSSMQNHLRGDLDDLRIYNRALSADDVRLLAGHQCPGDADRNSTVNFQDITAVLSNFNASCP